MPQDAEGIRHELLVLARRRSARVLGWPRDWKPTQVTNPKTGQPFTPVGAWEFIVELLERDIEIETKILDPPEEGKLAHIMQVSLGQRKLYVKLQLGSGRIIGRSFHYSEYDTKRSQ